MEAWNRVQVPPGGNAEGKTLIHEGHEGTRGLGYQVRGGCAAFQMHPGLQPEVCPPLARGTTGGVLRATEDPLPRNTRRSLLKASIPLKKGGKYRNLTARLDSSVR
jgi:hypothetical protein